MAAARGGFTSICAMPNLIPVPDSLKNLEPELEAIEKDARDPKYIATVWKEGYKFVSQTDQKEERK